VRAVDRLVRFQLAEGGELVARILEVDDEGLDLEVPGVKGRKATSRRLGFPEIDKARVQVEFSRKDSKNEKEEEA
jgi:ribosome maturation factor RimP